MGVRVNCLKDKVLGLLEQNPVVSGGELGKSLGVSRTAIWKAVNALREQGYEIHSTPGGGYSLNRDNDLLSPSAITANLKTQTLGRQLELLDTVDSTNLYLKRAAQQGAAEGLTVIARQQTHGKGRLGRTFHSPAESGIYMSILLRPDAPASDCALFTAATAVCVCRAVEEVAGVSLSIKWVNDLLYQGKKVCGILTEAALELEGSRLEYMVVGIGINTGGPGLALPKELDGIATTLYDICGARNLRNRLIAAILNHLEGFYRNPEACQSELLGEYSRRLCLKGQKVRLSTDDTSRVYTAIDIDSQAGLIIEDENGVRQTLTYGEVSVIPTRE